MKKEFHESKSCWAGGLLILLGIGTALLSGSISTESITVFLNGLGIIGIRQAINEPDKK